MYRMRCIEVFWEFFEYGRMSIDFTFFFVH